MWHPVKSKRVYIVHGKRGISWIVDPAERTVDMTVNAEDNRIALGTSSWQFDGWRGTFYPDRMASSGYLSFYAQIFPTVEVNTSFYAIPARRPSNVGARVCRTASRSA